MVERAFNLQCSLKHGLGGSNLLNIYGSLTSKDFSEFFSVLCPIKYFHMRHFSSCLSQHGRLSLLLFAFLASSSYPFSGLSFFFPFKIVLYVFCLSPPLFPPWLPTEGTTCAFLAVALGHVTPF